MDFRNIKNIKRNILNLIIISLLVVTITSYSVLAFGVTSPGSSEVYPGQIKDEFFFVGSESDMVVQAIMIEDGDGIASFADKNTKYTLPAGKSVKVPVKLRVPESAVIDSTYTVKVKFSQTNEPKGDEGIGFAQDVSMSFVVVVIEKPTIEPAAETPPIETKAAGTNILWWILLAVVIIVLVAWWLIMKSRKNSGEIVKKKKF